MTGFQATGGCQCGAVRYRIAGEIQDPHLCHCRMCQKAAGNYFMALLGVAETDIEITGEPGWFASSEIARRGFCARCGTPLFYSGVDSEYVAVTLGSLDDPAAVPPVSAYGGEAKVPFFEHLHELTTEETKPEDTASESRQHPDERP